LAHLCRRYEYGHQYGLVDETCQNYEAEDRACKPFGRCETCAPVNGSTCFTITNHTTYWVGDFGTVSGGMMSSFAWCQLIHVVAKMQAEIYARGPIGLMLYLRFLVPFTDNSSVFFPPFSVNNFAHPTDASGRLRYGRHFGIRLREYSHIPILTPFQEAYTGGIYSQFVLLPSINHEV
jgi:hypothetical protein